MAIATVASLTFAALAGGAPARSISKREAATFAAAKKRLTKKQKAKIRRQLLRQVKKNPRAVKSRSFLRKAALVNFVLPVTIRVRSPCPRRQRRRGVLPGGRRQHRAQPAHRRRARTSTSAPRSASARSGSAGTLPAEVQFRDSYDGGALGNVSVKLLPSNAASKQIQTTSVPILWNPDVSNDSSDAYGPISATTRA